MSARTVAVAVLALAVSASAGDFAPDWGAARELVLRARAARTRPNAAASCPPEDALRAPWVEHGGAPPRERRREHLAAALDSAAPFLVPAGTVSSWIGAARRGRGGDAGEPACRARGSAALYFIGPEDDPQVNFVKEVEAGGEAGLRTRLVELRWLDASDGRKHRWRAGAGSGLPLPDAINELL